MRIGLLFFLAYGLQAANIPNIDPLSAKGFDHFYSLEYNEAIATFLNVIAQHPDDPDAYNHLAQSVLYRQMFATGALESDLLSGTNPFLRRPKMPFSPADQKQFEEALYNATTIGERRLKSNPDDIGALYSLGVTHGLKANHSFLVRKNWIDALKEATAARKSHNHIVELDPTLIDARLAQGGHDYIVGSLPIGYKFLGFLAGVAGDRDSGIKTLQLVAQRGRINRNDAAIILVAIYRREKRPGDAVPLLRDQIEKFPRNYLLRFELAQMYGDLGDKPRALGSLAKIEELRRANAPGYARVAQKKVEYSKGNILFWYRDFDGAIAELKNATSRVDGDLTSGVLAWLRLGQAYDMKGRREEAQAAYRRAIDFAPQTDAAREAKDYLSNRYTRPDKD